MKNIYKNLFFAIGGIILGIGILTFSSFLGKADFLSSSIHPYSGPKSISLQNCIQNETQSMRDGTLIATYLGTPQLQNLSRTDILTQINPVLGHAVQNEEINWTWNKTTKQYTFKTYPGEEALWYCYFKNETSFFQYFLNSNSLQYQKQTPSNSPTPTSLPSSLQLGNIDGLSLSLILPVVHNEKTYYYLDKNGNNQADPGDVVTHDMLDIFFNGGQDTEDTLSKRTKIVGNYTIILPSESELLSLYNNTNIPNPPTGWSQYFYWPSTKLNTNLHSGVWLPNGQVGTASDDTNAYATFQISVGTISPTPTQTPTPSSTNTPTPTSFPNASAWVSNYSMGWWNIDALPSNFWSQPSHSINMGGWVRSDGSIDNNANGLTQTQRTKAVTKSHQENKPILYCVQGGNWGGPSEFVDALSSPTARQNLINNIMQIVNTDGYDGVDVDFEPVRSENASNYHLFIQSLATELAKKTDFQGKKRLLTAAIHPIDINTNVYGPVQQYFDQLNIMTYDMANGNPTVSFDSPLYAPFQNAYNVDDIVNGFLTTGGIAKNKLGIGISFDGFCYNSGTLGGSGSSDRREYTDFIHDPEFLNYPHQFHSVAQMEYVQGSNFFCSWNGPQAIAAKMQYVKDKGIGGVIIWESGGANPTQELRPYAVPVQ